MRRYVFMVFMVLLFHFSLNAQGILFGSICDQASKQILPYATIRIADRGIGTISNDEGKFSLEIPSGAQSDSLTVNYMGYYQKVIKISILEKDDTICLTKKIIHLKPVIVKAGTEEIQGKKKEGFVTLVLRRKNRKESLSGAEFGMLLRNKNRIKINKIRFYLAQNGYDTLKIRVNVYRTNHTRIQDRLNITHNYLTITNGKTGWFTFNVNNNYVVINGDYIVTLELVKVIPKTGALALKGTLTPLDRRGYVREHGKWKKSFVDMSLYTEVTKF